MGNNTKIQEGRTSSLEAISEVLEPCESVWWKRRKTVFTGTRVLILYGPQWNGPHLNVEVELYLAISEVLPSVSLVAPGQYVLKVHNIMMLLDLEALEETGGEICSRFSSPNVFLHPLASCAFRQDLANLMGQSLKHSRNHVSLGPALLFHKVSIPE